MENVSLFLIYPLEYLHFYPYCIWIMLQKHFFFFFEQKSQKEQESFNETKISEVITKNEITEWWWENYNIMKKNVSGKKLFTKVHFSVDDRETNHRSH